MDKIITKIKKTQLEIFENANANVMDLYFYIGKIIYENSEYGNNFINKISIELKLKFPNAKGYSPRNLRDMKKYYLSVKDNELLKKYSYKIPWSHNTLNASS